MKVYILTYGDDTYCGITVNEASARSICNDEFNQQLGVKYEEEELDLSQEDLQDLADEEIVAHCFDCGVSLAKNEVYFAIGDLDCKYNYCFCDKCVDRD